MRSHAGDVTPGASADEVGSDEMHEDDRVHDDGDDAEGGGRRGRCFD
jgi:hypothetical protein